MQWVRAFGGRRGRMMRADVVGSSSSNQAAVGTLAERPKGMEE